jgi:hypothetical protein
VFRKLMIVASLTLLTFGYPLRALAQDAGTNSAGGNGSGNNGNGNGNGGPNTVWKPPGRR